MSDAEVPTPSPATRVFDTRSWQTPVLTELPKLTKLTLASAIGGGGGTGGGGSTVFGILLAIAALTGCAMDREVEPAGPVRTSPVATVDCQADVATQRITCGGPARAPGTELFGDQGISVQLRSANVHYNTGTMVFSFDVSVQNLGAQTLGYSYSAVDVFFLSDPIVTSGSGSITPLNASLGTYTAADQWAYQYAGPLQPKETSAEQNWQLLVPPTVNTFTFQVMVSADVREAGGIRQWSPVYDLTRYTLTDIAGTDKDHLMVVGNNGASVRWDNMVATAIVPTTDESFMRVEALGGGRYVAVGGSGGIYVYDGANWTKTFQLSTYAPLVDVWVLDADFFVAVSNEKAVVYEDGVYSEETTGGSFVGWVGGSSHDTVYAADGNNTIVARIDGAWTAPVPLAIPASEEIQGFAFRSPTDWAVSTVIPAADSSFVHVMTDSGLVTRVMWESNWAQAIRYADLGTGPLVISVGEQYKDPMHRASLWEIQLDDPAALAGFRNFSSLFGTSPTSLKMLADGTALTTAYDVGATRWGHPTGFMTVVPTASTGLINSGIWGTGGKVWMPTADGSVSYFSPLSGSGSEGNLTSFSLNALWGVSATELYAASGEGKVYQGNGSGSWAEVVGTPMTDQIFGIWGDAGTGNLFTAGEGGEAGARISGSWSLLSTGTSESLKDVWGCSGSEAWFVGGNGTILHYAGGVFTSQGIGGPFSFEAVSGTSCSDVWAAGENGIFYHYDGTSWSDVHDGINTYYLTLYADAPGQVWGGGNDGTVTHTILGDDRSRYMVPGGGMPVNGIWKLGADTLVVAGYQSVYLGTR